MAIRSPLLPLLLLALGPAPALGDETTTPHPLPWPLRQTVATSKSLLIGPAAPRVPADFAHGSCDELYLRRLDLLRQTADYVPAYWDDPRNSATVAIGTLWTPVFYFLGYTAVTEYQRAQQDVRVDAKLSALRRASADQHCFMP